MTLPASATECVSRPWLLSPWTIVAVQALVSAAGLVVEIVAGRMLAPYVGMSIYTWTAVIAVVLAGFSVGHWVGGVMAERSREDALGMVAVCLALAALTTALTLSILRATAAGVLGNAPSPGLAILALAALIVFLPSFFAGTPSPVLAKTIVDLEPTRAGKALGAIFAASSIGAIAGTLGAGFVFISWLGSTATIVAVSAIYTALAFLLLALVGKRAWRIATLAAAIAALALSGYNLAASSACTEESRYYCIRIVDFTPEIGSPAKLMVLDHLGHGINLAEHPEELVTPYVALIDRVLRERLGARPASSFFIGGGAYTLPRAWLAASSDARITVAEIDPAVTRIARREMWVPADGLNVVHEDARAALGRFSERYEVIVGDAFTDIAVPPHLVTREFFGLVAARLQPAGIYAMNVVDHLPDMDALLAIRRTLLEVFDAVEVFAETDDVATGGRTTFVLFASATPSGLKGVTDDSRSFAQIAPEQLDRLSRQKDVPILTDDYAPIDRLVGIGEL